MLLPALLLFVAFLLLSAFFSSSETALIASNPLTLDYLEKKGSKRAVLIKRMLARMDDLLATVLIGNTLVNAASASVATFIFVSFFPANQNKAVFLATLTTTLFILFFGEINPKTFAAYHPIKVSYWLVYPLRAAHVLFFPLVKIFTFFSGLLFRSAEAGPSDLSRALNEEETKILLTTRIKGLSLLRKKMITESLDISSRPIKEVMVPRPQVKAIEISASPEQIKEIMLVARYSRYPVYRGRLDNIEGILHVKDILPPLIENGDFRTAEFLHKPLFIPESASLEKAILQMQENRTHLALVVDEFGNMEGIVTLADIIEEIVGKIHESYREKEEDWHSPAGPNSYLIKGAASIKDINRELPFKIPEKANYTTLAGFFLDEYGKIPKEKDSVSCEGIRLIVEKMNKRHISLIRVLLTPKEDQNL